MTRIVGGSARGRRLKVPASGTRPTSDRVREAVFSSLDSAGAIRGARVLDLYAGTGALGLEALSRGASTVTLVDHAGSAVHALQHNVRSVGMPGVTVRRQACRAFLRTPPTAFDLVFLDPPYELAAVELNGVLGELAGGWLAPGARVIVERAANAAGICWPAGLVEQWQRRFGDTLVLRAVWYGHEQVPPS